MKMRYRWLFFTRLQRLRLANHLASIKVFLAERIAAEAKKIAA